MASAAARQAVGVVEADGQGAGLNQGLPVGGDAGELLGAAEPGEEVDVQRRVVGVDALLELERLGEPADGVVGREGGDGLVAGEAGVLDGLGRVGWGGWRRASGGRARRSVGAWSPTRASSVSAMRWCRRWRRVAPRSW